MYLDREEERRKLPPELNNCPTECPNLPRYYDEFRSSYCGECPHKSEADAFESATTDLFFEMFGRAETKYSFGAILSAVYNAKRFAELPREEMSVKTAEMVLICQSEKARADAIKEVSKPD